MLSDPFFQPVSQVDDETSLQVVEGLYMFSSILSIIGSGTIILSYFLVKELRRFPFSLILFLSICDFFFSIKFFVSAFTLTKDQDSDSIVSKYNTHTIYTSQ